MSYFDASCSLQEKNGGKSDYFELKSIDFLSIRWYNAYILYNFRRFIMEHIKTLETRNLCDSAKDGGCGECQTSCQSACKTSCGIANQQCESTKDSKESE